MSSKFAEDMKILDQQVNRTIEVLKLYHGLENAVKDHLAHVGDISEHNPQEATLIDEVKKWLDSLERIRKWNIPSPQPSTEPSTTKW